MINIAPSTSIALAILSGMLIAFGLASIWRDRRQVNRNFSRAPAGPVAAAVPDSELADVQIYSGRGVTVEAPQTPEPDVAAAVIAAAPKHAAVTGPAVAALDELKTSLAAIRHEALDDLPESQRQPWVEQRWRDMMPVLADAVDTLNGTTSTVGVTIGAAGEPNWSFKNRGFGTYRRILAGDQSLAWLRLELAPEGRLVCKVRAHKDDQAQVNSRVELPAATLSPRIAVDALARCLKSVSEYAAWHAPDPSVAPEPEPETTGFSWRDVAFTAEAALQATNGALSQAGARLAVLANPAFEPSIDRDRWPLSIEVNGRTVALMHVDRVGELVEVSVGVADRNRLDLGRRQQAAIDDLTPHGLAELMASCAWPSIADAHQTAQRAS